ncbi:hypothetical protein Vadar_026923 [Vaccinium darrowii]|uniref:Uncharacterized protein n=1 Tax=Vaccinium darrowii TaxID=229202 RepID=A0ACB7YAQ9_9ERIC|nr:hypothetical protein Vadar_026923 [Vaccinium darrowii]
MEHRGRICLPSSVISLVRGKVVKPVGFTPFGSALNQCNAVSEGSSGLPPGRLFSPNIDGAVSHWDLFDLKEKVALDSIGVSIWQMAAGPIISLPRHTKDDTLLIENGHANDKIGDGDDPETSESEDDSDLVELHEQPTSENTLMALACDDGCVRIYSISDSDKLTYVKSLTQVGGRVLSVTWSPDGNSIYSGSSDGYVSDFEVVEHDYNKNTDCTLQF